MNIYNELQKLANKNGTVTLKKLNLLSAQTGCNISLLWEHRRVFHQMTQIRRRPINKNAPISDKGNFIDSDGNLRATSARPRATSSSWSDKTPTKYYEIRATRERTVRVHRFETCKFVYDFFDDRQYNVVFINENTIPKYCPKSRTICLDRRSNFTDRVQKHLKKVLVLRAIPLQNNQFNVIFMRQDHSIHQSIATITETTFGLGKTVSGSARSMRTKTKKAVTAALHR